MLASPSVKLSTFGKLPCAQCGASLTVPVWSEYVADHQVRHLWNCDACEYQFETLVIFRSGDAPGIVPPLMAA
jgi:hypothetical protein